MQYLIATYWMWCVMALLVGGVVGYWLRWRLGARGGSSQVLRWGTAAFLIGVIIAFDVFHGGPSKHPFRSPHRATGPADVNRAYWT